MKRQLSKVLQFLNNSRNHKALDFKRLEEPQGCIQADPSGTHRWPNISVDLVSASLNTDGEQQMTMVVLQFPPRESWRIRVILLSR